MPKKKGRIVDAAMDAMIKVGHPMTVQELYKIIIDNQLYTFGADDPMSVLRGKLRKHCQGLDFPSAAREKYFVILPDGKFFLKDSSFQRDELPIQKQALEEDDAAKKLQILHANYLDDFRGRVLSQLQKLDPFDFEEFGRQVLEHFGFENVVVTEKSNDGGIDGYGDLEIGMGYLKFGFQCKRYAKDSSIGPSILREFRGALNEKGLSQGIFFTTSRFSKAAKEAALIKNAIPIMLFDGREIVNLMIQKGFGVEISNQLPIYNYALELDS